ncbi:beta-lactamase/transpeptidase-like protein [Bimuria novae-zelandiae CBS 107.79]|uniref:Beta-lactamase/transpeptidase-like protein n=1 Tax=Bimuria novae-zelandiae CBS 107.79 TaxID=1447943 RepID=A0A6A5VMZ5_9PLEO|nr:beta-lactamase/transpeptidase-like protein [Bimuria novae-zelandiae CBS 107.79]
MFSVLYGVTFVASVAATCYEPSFGLPPPGYDRDHPVLKDAFTHLHDILTIALGDPKYNSTSISVEVTSSKESLWEFHHTARERNASRPDIPHVNGSALYRIASITKTFTVLGLLQQHAAGNLNLDGPVDKYIGELKGPQNGTIPWKDITLRSLASQLSGIPREFAQSDLINGDVDLATEEYGLPPISREGLITCDEYSEDYQKPCTANDLIRSVKADHPIFAPNQQSTYSNVAFELIALVIANVTNQTYESYIDDAIFKPLEMTKSTFSRPEDSAGVIPLWPHYWDVDEGVQNPTGGIYTSTNDLSKYLRYILTHCNGITHALNWLHPVSNSKDQHSFYGMPWEIFQTDRVLSNSQRTIRFVTKGGGLPSYFTLIIVIPQYDLGISLLLAGPPDFLATLRETVSIGVVRAAEEFAIAELQQSHAGRYIAAGLNSSLILNADYRGLVVQKWISNSTDVLQSDIIHYMGKPKDKSWYLLLVPTLLYRDEENQKGEIWRMHVATERYKGERDVWDDFCSTDIDGVLYGGIPINEVVLWKGSSGLVYDIELAGFRANLTRIFSHSPAASNNVDIEHDEDHEQMEL